MTFFLNKSIILDEISINKIKKVIILIKKRWIQIDKKVWLKNLDKIEYFKAKIL